MKIVKKRIFAGVERPEHKDRSGLRREDLLLAQLIAFKFGGRIATVDQLQLEPPVRRDFKALWRNRSILELDRENRLLLGPCNARAASERAARKIAATLRKPPTSTAPFNRHFFFQFPHR
jgi:hypothetical protein